VGGSGKESGRRVGRQRERVCESVRGEEGERGRQRECVRL
jgi:hypothetical protein